MADEDEVGLPQKGLNMIIKDVVPDLRIANETRELLNHCCVEFIKHVSREAQRISSCDQRKTIYHDHVQKALSNLGFPVDYVRAADSVLEECKVAAAQRLNRKKSRLDRCGIPEEELYMMQQELIEKARRDEAEKQRQQLLQQATMATSSTASASGVVQTPTAINAYMTSIIMNNLVAAQNNPDLMAQLLASNALPPELAQNLSSNTHQLEWVQAWVAQAVSEANNARMTIVSNENSNKSESSSSAVKMSEHPHFIKPELPLQQTPLTQKNASGQVENYITSSLQHSNTTSSTIADKIKSPSTTEMNSLTSLGAEFAAKSGQSLEANKEQSQAGPIMSNEMRARLAADFVHSLNSANDNDDNFD